MIGYQTPPTLDDIRAMAETALASIPEFLSRHVRGLGIRVEEFPDAETVREMALESPFDLLGLYRGVSLDRRSVLDVYQDVDCVMLYRRPILDFWCETGEPLPDVVRHVLIHEIGHHFGFSDEDMDDLERDLPPSED